MFTTSIAYDVKARKNLPVLDLATRLAEAGISSIGIAPTRRKQPVGIWDASQQRMVWDPFKTRIATPDERAAMFKPGYGIAIVCGAVSGGVEVIDFDEPALIPLWRTCVEAVCPGILGQLVQTETPDGGHHYIYRHTGPQEGSAKLAEELRPDDDGKLRPHTLIETRAEGGLAIVPPTPGACHLSGRPYQLRHGSLLAIPTIGADVRGVLLGAARLLNKYEKPASKRPEQPTNAARSTSYEGHGGRPGDDFNERATWGDVLEPHGWHHDRQRGDVDDWTRPGKKEGVSATTNYQGSGLLYVFSSNASPFESLTSYTKFAAYALLNHDGDFAAAASALAQQGYGDPPGPRHWHAPAPESGPIGPDEGSSDSRKGVFERVTDDDTYVVPGPLLRLLMEHACLWQYHQRIGKVRAVVPPKRDGEQAQVVSLPPADRVLLETIAGIQQTAPTDTEATPRQRFFRDDLADKTGLSPSTISVRVPDLAAKGLIDFESRKVLRTRKMANKRTGVLEERIVEEREWWLGLQPVPRALLHDVDLKQGPKAKADADRKCCPQCGSRHLKATHFQCEACGATCTAAEAIQADRERRASTPPVLESKDTTFTPADEAVEPSRTSYSTGGDEAIDPFALDDVDDDEAISRNPARTPKEGTHRIQEDMFPGVPPLEPLNLSAHREAKERGPSTSGGPPPYCSSCGGHEFHENRLYKGTWHCNRCEPARAARVEVS